MGVWLYNLVSGSYFAGIRVAASFSKKAKLWITGRQHLFDRLAKDFSGRDPQVPLIWMHCASLGEFEQGRPLLETLRRERPGLHILLTFFSPSGFEIRKDYPVANWVHYLPADSASNARRFLAIVRPSLAIFVKYEFWYHYLFALAQNKVPVFLLAAVFKPGHPFFHWYGGIYRKMLAFFTGILVQDRASLELVAGITKTPVKQAGDTRVDRVVSIAGQSADLPVVAAFCGEGPVLVCGSTWPEDERIIHQWIQLAAFGHWKIILAPHDVAPGRLADVEHRFGGMALRYSQALVKGTEGARLLLIDNVGMLSKLYRFGKIAYIGGGFGKGIHNTLEPIAYSIPVVFGPRFGKFAEAQWLVAHGGGFTVDGPGSFIRIFQALSDGDFYRTACRKAIQYIRENQGATQRSLAEIEPWLGPPLFQDSL